MGCNEAGGYAYCKAGAWQVPRLSAAGDESIAGIGMAVSGEGGEAIMIITTFTRPHKDLVLECETDTTLKVDQGREVSGAQFRSVRYTAESDDLDDCLSRPIRMTVDGQSYHLGTKLLRQALENARQY